MWTLTVIELRDVRLSEVTRGVLRPYTIHVNYWPAVLPQLMRISLAFKA